MYKFPQQLALATTDSSGNLHNGEYESTSHIIPLVDMHNRGADIENDGASAKSGGEQHPTESI